MSSGLKKVLIFGGILVVLFFILNAKIGFFKSDSVAQGEPSQMQHTPVSVEIAEPEVLERKISVTGTVRADEWVELKSEAAGIVSRIYFKEGQRVQKGRLLVSLNDDELKAQLEKLKIRKELYQSAEAREKQLREKEAISQEEYDITLNELHAVDADIKAVEAEIAKKHIHAPFTGTIGLRQVSEGSYVSNNTTIASIYNTDRVKIDFSVPGRYSWEIKTGQPFVFRIENLPGSFTGTIYAIEPQIDPNTRTLQIRGIAENTEGKLLPGQFANIEIILETVDSALTVPAIAVIPELNGHKLFKYSNGKALEVPVEIGQRTDTRVQIVAGLNAGDTTLTSGILQVRDGSPVVIANVN